jgi:hypothetical protein
MHLSNTQEETHTYVGTQVCLHVHLAHRLGTLIWMNWNTHGRFFLGFLYAWVRKKLQNEFWVSGVLDTGFHTRSLSRSYNASRVVLVHPATLLHRKRIYLNSRFLHEYPLKHFFFFCTKPAQQEIPLLVLVPGSNYGLFLNNGYKETGCVTRQNFHS